MQQCVTLMAVLRMRYHYVVWTIDLY